MQYALKLVTNFDMQHACMVLTWLRKCVKALKNTKESRVLATKFFFQIHSLSNLLQKERIIFH